MALAGGGGAWGGLGGALCFNGLIFSLATGNGRATSWTGQATPLLDDWQAGLTLLSCVDCECSVKCPSVLSHGS